MNSILRNSHRDALIIGFLMLAALLMFAPGYIRAAQTVWSRTGNEHGPIMLALAAWLVWHKKLHIKLKHLQASSGSQAIGLFLLAAGCIAYVFGAPQQVLTLQLGAAPLIAIGAVLAIWGLQGAKIAFLPILFLALAAPFPQTLVDSITMPLKLLVSIVTEHLLHRAGYSVAREGVILYVEQYRLLVADACSGINSVFVLEAIGILYINLISDPDKRRTVALAMMIIPISIASNITRVLTLCMMTLYISDDFAQGFAHDASGILLMVVATGLTVACDTVICKVLKVLPQGRSN